MSEETFISDGKLEAKVVSTTQNDKGWYIRLLLHPSDAEEVTKLRYGAVLDIRWREVLNVEVEPIVLEPNATPAGAVVAKVSGATAGETAHKPKERFEDMPLVKQAVLRCGDSEFIRYLTESYPNTMKDNGYSAAIFVREHCAVASRSEIRPGTGAGGRYLGLEADYQDWLTDQKYGAQRR